MAGTNLFDSDIDMIALAFATRQLLSDLDRDLIIQRGLESLSDFGRSERLGLWFYDEIGEAMTAGGGFLSGRQVTPTGQRSVAGTPAAEVVSRMTPETYPLTYVEDLPWPTFGDGVPERRCLCAPLVAADQRLIGMVTFDHPAGAAIGGEAMQPLIVLLTVFAISLETARLFRLAVIDGLTGLYVRRYFELRMAEEENRIRRYGGRLALLIMDIDHFKTFNDTYGHQQGDAVLKETAAIIQQSVRSGLDVACRYGGEEFIAIMPNTDADGALVVAERIRRACEGHAFSGQDRPLHVTLSGGIAVMDGQTVIAGPELLKRADDALYRAKRDGRNRVRLWEAPAGGIPRGTAAA